MKFTVALACIFLSISTLVSAARVTSRGSCEGSQVTGNTTIPYNGNDIGVVTGSCSPSGSTKRSTLEGRQYSLCTEGTCSITCEDTSYYTIYGSDCDYVLEYLTSYPEYTVTIPAYSYHEYYYGSCAVVFYNYDVYAYDVCFLEIAYDAAAAILACAYYTNGAVCDGSMLPGDAYKIAVQGP